MKPVIWRVRNSNAT